MEFPHSRHIENEAGTNKVEGRGWGWGRGKMHTGLSLLFCAGIQFSYDSVELNAFNNEIKI